MAEFVVRGYNVAMPEIDIGDDIFVVKDSDGDLNRIQVKTAIAKPQRKDDCYLAQFSVAYTHLEKPRKPDITYVFVVRYKNTWSDFIIIPRRELSVLRQNSNIGSLSTNKQTGQQSLVLKLAFKPGEVICSGLSLLQYRNCWDDWPAIDHRRP